MSALKWLKGFEQEARAPVYFLYGEESFLVRECLSKIIDRFAPVESREFNLEMFDAKSTQAGDWTGSANTLSFMGGEKIVVVMRLDEASPSDSDTKQILAYLDEPNPTSSVIFTANKIDRKRKLIKKLVSLKGAIECGPQKTHDLMSWLKERSKSQGYDLTQDAANKLLERVGPQLGRLASELDKVLTFSGKTKKVSSDSIVEMVGEIKMESVFVFIEALKKKQPLLALKLLKDQLDRGEEALKILGAIVWQFRLIWEVGFYQQKKMSTAKISEKTGQKAFVIEKALGHTRHFSGESLKKAFRWFSDADRELKSGHDPEAVLKSLVLKLSQSEAQTKA